MGVSPCLAIPTMILPDEYRTGNKGLDEKIAKALSKSSYSPTRLQILQTVQVPLVDNSRIKVAVKEQRTYKDGTVFASRGELVRWDYLLKVQDQGEIANLKRQVPFVLQESFYNTQYGKIEPIIYISDFTYTNITLRPGLQNQEVVEDSKGYVRSDKFLIKRKMFLKCYPSYYFFEV